MYRDRQDAGRKLAELLRRYAHEDTVVLALPRGGILLGAEVARSLHAPLGVVLVKKIEHPLYPEYAIGAVVEDEAPLYGQGGTGTIDEEWLQSAEAKARRLLEQRHNMYYRGGIEQPQLSGKVVLVVDDGIATGLTMQASVNAVRRKHPAEIVVAVPVASPESVELLNRIADKVYVLENPSSFVGAVGGHYMKFNQVDDAQVASLLREVNQDVYAQATSHG